MADAEHEGRRGERRRARADAAAEASGGEGGRGATASWLAEWVRSLLVAALLFLIIKTFLIQTFVITSGSMKNTLLVGDFVMVNRAAIGSPIPFTDLFFPGYSEPHRWDVIVFDPPHEDELMLVKRLVGMPGDTLAMRDGVLVINGEPMHKPWVVHTEVPDDGHPWMAWQRDHLVDSVDAARYRPTRDTWGPIVIPSDRYFMLGDNREHSLDSRYWGLLEGWRLEGRAVFIYFSYNRDSFQPFPWVREIRWGRIGRAVN